MAEPSQDLTHIYLEHLINYAVFGLETVVVLTLIAIVAITLVDIFRISLSSLNKKKEEQPKRIHEIVSRMLRGLIISLDFLVAADILKSILVPSLFELAQLAIVVIIRILLSWSLSKEIHSHS